MPLEELCLVCLSQDLRDPCQGQDHTNDRQLRNCGSACELPAMRNPSSTWHQHSRGKRFAACLASACLGMNLSCTSVPYCCNDVATSHFRRFQIDLPELGCQMSIACTSETPSSSGPPQTESAVVYCAGLETVSTDASILHSTPRNG